MLVNISNYIIIINYINYLLLSLIIIIIHYIISYIIICFLSL